MVNGAKILSDLSGRGWRASCLVTGMTSGRRYWQLCHLYDEENLRAGGFGHLGPWKTQLSSRTTTSPGPPPPHNREAKNKTKKPSSPQGPALNQLCLKGLNGEEGISLTTL